MIMENYLDFKMTLNYIAKQEKDFRIDKVQSK